MRFALLFLPLLLAGCGGSGPARVKGQLTENGQPKAMPAGTSSVLFTLVDPDGKPDAGKSYTAVVNADGTFEVVASGGELPPGTYIVSIQVRGKLAGLARGLSGLDSPIRRELKPGQNDLVIDLTNPTG